MHQPVDRLFHCAPDADPSGIDRAAKGASSREQPDPGGRHYPSAFLVVPLAGTARLRGDAEAFTPPAAPVAPPAGRLVSRSLFICSGVLTSGSEILTFALARAT